MLNGKIEKMITALSDPVDYQLPIGDERLPMNQLLGQQLSLRYAGAIYCIHCGAKTKKSFSQGHCYRCHMRLASCDMCILKPETCHYDQGTCREPGWGEAHCMIPHYVYLANSSGLKVGITRTTQVPTRWIDQGATQALPILKVQTRFQSGLIETALKAHVKDTTNWRAMLKGDVEEIDLPRQRDRLLGQIGDAIEALGERFGDDAVEVLDEQVVDIHYPVLTYPTKVRSFNLDKQPEARGQLEGIKGQYLIFDSGVINLRKYTGYELLVEAS